MTATDRALIAAGREVDAGVTNAPWIDTHDIRRVDVVGPVGIVCRVNLHDDDATDAEHHDARGIAWLRNNLAALLDGYERALDDLGEVTARLTSQLDTERQVAAIILPECAGWSPSDLVIGAHRARGDRKELDGVLATLRTVLAEDPIRSLSEDSDALRLAQLAAGDLRQFRAQIERTRIGRDHWRESRNSAMAAGEVLKSECELLRAELRKWQSPCADVGDTPDGWVCPTCKDPKCGDV